ncbi:uncharacterized protein [Apostichopus japonicus]|uniref:uncharacterized protein n=1 Tax=Stichopus japonicus TaxID=307972 RepID=UPI003AB4E733
MIHRKFKRDLRRFGILVAVSTIFAVYYILRSGNNVSRVKENRRHSLTQMRGSRFADNHGSQNVTDHELLMEVCPIGWTLQTLQKDSQKGTSVSQFCTKDDESNEWACLAGWVKLPYPPFCQLRERELVSQLSIPELLRYSQISEVNKLIFIHISKSGGEHLERSFLFDDRRKEVNGHYLGGHHPIRSFDKSIFHGYVKIGVLRHPCSRLISVWRLLSNRNIKWMEGKMDNETSSNFPAFVEKTLENISIEEEEHLKSQVGMLFHDDEKFGLDQHLVYESWNESMDVLGNLIKSDVSSLKMKLSALDGNDDCTEMYTSTSWEKMLDLYAMDMCVLGYSRDITATNVLPPLSWTPEIFTERYKHCKTRFSLSNIEAVPKIKPDAVPYNNGTLKDIKCDNCVIYTYFQSLSNDKDTFKKDKENTLETWNNAWSSAGWTPRIINEDDAKRHPSYQALREKFATFPTRGNAEYEIACFLRYLAMAAVGGGWMSDFDVLPINFPASTERCHNGALTVYQRFVPALVSGNASEYTRVATLMADISWESLPEFTVKGSPHVSDMLCLRKLIADGQIRSEWLVASLDRIFSLPFSCDNVMTQPSKPMCLKSQKTLSFPVAIHFAHSSMSKLTKDRALVSALWGNSTSFREQERGSKMKFVYNFIRQRCISFK